MQQHARTVKPRAKSGWRPIRFGSQGPKRRVGGALGPWSPPVRVELDDLGGCMATDEAIVARARTERRL